MRAENDSGAVRHLIKLIDKHRAARPQPLDDMAVVHHFMPDVDRGAEQFQRPLDDLDRAVYPGAESARTG